MAFCDNLLYLRKKAKITQEDLAYELDVSRQSVSKWETGEAYPETEKLIALCDKFGVSMDQLVRGNCCVSEEAPTPREDGCEPTDEPIYTDVQEYKKKIRSFAFSISFGVFLIMFGVAACVFLCGLAERYDSQRNRIITIVGGAVLLLFVAAAVFLFVQAGISDKNFHRRNPHLGELFTKEERAQFEKKFGIAVACLVSGILLDIVALIIACVLVEQHAGEHTEMAICCVVAVFLLLLGGIVGGLCCMGIAHDKINLSNIHCPESQQGRTKKLCDGICNTIMLVATAIYLLIGFVWDLWHPGWIVFPVGGIICAIVSTISKILEKRED